jgi:hypothetical protein
MDSLNLLYHFITFLLGCLVVVVIQPFLRAYSAKKAENLATKEDIARITKAQEEIKAQISADMWNQQRHWELKRDVVIDLIRAMADMDRLIPDFSAAFSSPHGILTDEAKQHLMRSRINSFKDERRCTSEYLRAHTIADLSVHGKLSRASSSYFQLAARILREIPSNPGRYDSEARLQLAKLHNAAIIAARRELGVNETDDLPVLDYEALSSGRDTSQ